MASQKMQAVKIILADGREGLFVGRPLVEVDVDDHSVSEVALSDVIVCDDRISIHDLWLLTQAGSPRIQ